ncbi:MAG: hypothetical protein H7A33_01205 [Deltaproteobacteria bacterium]|nr:hypothetical protein [Deltaproteobacteria bacterium]
MRLSALPLTMMLACNGGQNIKNDFGQRASGVLDGPLLSDYAPDGSKRCEYGQPVQTSVPKVNKLFFGMPSPKFECATKLDVSRSLDPEQVSIDRFGDNTTIYRLIGNPYDGYARFELSAKIVGSAKEKTTFQECRLLDLLVDVPSGAKGLVPYQDGDIIEYKHCYNIGF